MIISHKHRFIFIAIPKTATHAIREALRPRLDRYDWEQCWLFEKKAFPLEPLARIGHGHLTCEDIRPFLLPGTWERYFKFCFVRDPFDRFASYCHFINRNNRQMQLDPLGTMKSILQGSQRQGSQRQGSQRQDSQRQGSQRRRSILLRPQFEFITDPAGQVLADYVGRFESLQSDFETVCRRLDLPEEELKIKNDSLRKPGGDCYDDELQEMIRHFYAADFALFDYTSPRSCSNTF